MKYQVLQLPVEDDLCFRGWDDVQKYCPNSKDLLKRYKLVYEGELGDDYVVMPANKILEDLFRILNIDHPTDYRARSLSMSDTVALCDASGTPTSYWFCDSWGWAEIK